MNANAEILKGGCRFIAVFMVVGVFLQQASAKTPDDTLVMALNIDAVNTFDPAQSLETVTGELLRNICSALVEFDQDEPAIIRPAMAKSWDISDDGRVFIFHLRDDLKFDDGRIATAQDLAWSMQRIAKLGFGYAQIFADYGLTKDNIEENVRALDDRSLRVELDKSYPVQLVLAAIGQSYSAALLDRQTLEKNAVDGDMGNKYLSTRSACVGPYKLAHWKPAERIVLKAARHYWGDKPKIETILVRHIPESGVQKLLLEKGDVDIARNLSSDDVLDIETKGGSVRIDRVLRPQSVYWALSKKNTALANEKVRSALHYLVDYDNLSKTVLKGIAVPRASYVPLGVPGALDEKEGAPFKLDLEKARRLIREAGYSDGFQASILVSSFPYMLPIAQSIQENARKIGITLTIQKVAHNQLLSRVRSGNYEMAIMSWNTTEPDGHSPSVRHIFNPDPTFTQNYNMYLAWRAGYYDAKANKMVMDALFEKDQNKRLKQYRDLQHYILEHGPAIYLFQTYNIVGLGASVKKWAWNGFNIYYSDAEKYKQ